jgi:hypothetical protein
MPDLRAYLANCLIGVHTITAYGTSPIRDTVEFHCGGQIFILKQKPTVINGQISDFRGRFCETSEILVRDVQPSQVQKTLQAIDRICWLLSFAGLSQVVCYGHDYQDGGLNQSRQTVIGTAESFRPTLNIEDGALVKSFIEQTYPNFVSLEKSRKINVVINYLLEAERRSQPIECKLIFAFILLENLKYTFATSKLIPYVKGFFRKGPGAKDKTYSFKELLECMFRDVGMPTASLKQIITLRNELIHSGLSRNSLQQNWTIYEEIHDLLREYLLRLLGYHGNYLTYVSQGNAQATI